MTALSSTAVINVRDRRAVELAKADGRYVPVHRPTRWGNPFRIGRDGTREEVVEKYRQWIATQPGLMADVTQLRGKVLGCFCRPLDCHADMLAVMADFGRHP